MRGRQALERLLTDIDGRGYGSYKRLRGTYDLGLCRLVIDHVQAIRTPRRRRCERCWTADSRTPDDLVDTPLKRVAVGDFLTRRCHEAASRVEGADVEGPSPSARRVSRSYRVPAC